MEELQLETEQFDFKSKDFKLRGEPVYRINANGRRYYYQMVNGYPMIFASGTTLINDGFPDPSNALEDWKVKMRVQGEDPEAFAQHRANYGTVMHTLFGEFLAGTPIDLNSLGTFIKGLSIKFMSEEVKNGLVKTNLEEFRRDMLAFITWAKDYNVKLIAVELMVASKLLKVATAVDLICELDIDEKGFWGEVYKSGERKGQPKETKKRRRVIGVVDFKSGKKGFYDKHAIQLQLSREMLAEVYPDLKVEKLFNFSPKNWRTSPDYNFKDQTENRVIEELPEVMSIGKKRHERKSKRMKLYNGSLNIDNLEGFDYNNHYKTIDLEEYILKFANKPKNPLQDIVKANNVRDRRHFHSIINKIPAKDLKELSKGIGIKYTKKDLFVEKLTEKYTRDYGKK